MTRNTLYPEIQPFKEEMLQVSSLHRIHVEQCGNPDGKPVIMIHGGPGGGITPAMRRLHDPEKYRIILLTSAAAVARHHMRSYARTPPGIS